MERQKHQSGIKGETAALTCDFNPSICLWNVDPYSWATEKNTEHGDEMLQKTHGYLLHPTCHQRGSPAEDQPSHRPTWWPAHHCYKAETEVVRTHHQILRPCKDHLTRNRTRWKETRETKEKMGRQHRRMDSLETQWGNESCRGQRGMERAGQQIVCGAPTTLRGYVIG